MKMQHEEPIIIEETPLSQEQVFEQYMLGKDQAHLDSLRLDMIDNGNFKSEYRTLWQSMPSSFFKMKVNPNFSANGSDEPANPDDGSAGNYEFLKNPAGYELNHEQKQFISKYYNDYTSTNPYIVLEWLLGKALSYEVKQQNCKISAYAGQLSSSELNVDQDEDPIEHYATFEPEADLDDSLDIFTEQLTK